MNNFAALYKVYLRNLRFTKADSKKNKIKLVGYVFLAIVICGIIALACVMAYFLSTIMLQNNALEFFLSAFMFSAQMLTLIFGSISLVSVVFKSKDNELLRGLPIRPTVIFWAKMANVFTTNLLLPAIFLLPIFITVGATTGMGAVYYILMLIAVLFTPQIPLILATIIAIPVLYISRYLKQNPVASLIAAILAYAAFLAVYLGIVFLCYNSLGDIPMDDPNYVAAMLTQPFKNVAYIIYPNIFIARAMIGVNAGANFGIYIAIMIAAFAIVIGLAYLAYNKVTESSLESRAKVNKRGKHRENVASITLTLVVNDLRNLLGQTGLMFSSIIGILIAPVFAIVMGIVSKEINSVIFIALLCVGGMNYFATIAVSRDNDKFFINKFLPITPKQYVGSKLLMATMYVIITSTIMALTLLAFGFLFLDVIVLFAVMVIYGVGNSAFALRRDLAKPVLNWTNMKEITNNRLTVMIPILAAFIFGFGTMMLQTLFANMSMTENAVKYLPFVILLAISIIFALVSYYFLYRDSERLYKKIEASNG